MQQRRLGLLKSSENQLRPIEPSKSRLEEMKVKSEFQEGAGQQFKPASQTKLKRIKNKSLKKNSNK